MPLVLPARDIRKLIASAVNFAECRGGSIDVPESKDKAAILASLYKQMERLLEKDETLGLFHDEEMGETEFVLKRWPMAEQMVYFIPIAFTYQLEDKALGLLLRRFLHTFEKKQHWESIFDTFYFEGYMENTQYELESNPDDFDDDEKAMFMSYLKGGEAFNRLEEFDTLELLSVDEFKAFVPREQDKDLYDAFASGLDFLENDYGVFNRCWSMSRYVSFDEGIYGDERPIVNPIEELFSIVWEEDAMVDRMIDDISNYYQCGDTEQDLLVEEYVLKPKGELVFDDTLRSFMEFVDKIAKVSHERVH